MSVTDPQPLRPLTSPLLKRMAHERHLINQTYNTASKEEQQSAIQDAQQVTITNAWFHEYQAAQIALTLAGIKEYDI